MSLAEKTLLKVKQAELNWEEKDSRVTETIARLVIEQYEQDKVQTDANLVEITAVLYAIL